MEALLDLLELEELERDPDTLLERDLDLERDCDLDLDLDCDRERDRETDRDREPDADRLLERLRKNLVLYFLKKKKIRKTKHKSLPASGPRTRP